MTGVFADVRGAGTPVLLIHGLTIDHRMLLPLELVFEAHPHPWERHYIDLPGHGHTPRLPSMTTDTVADALTSYVDTALTGATFAMVGASFGGWCARALHARHSERVAGTALLAPAMRAADRRTVDTTEPTASDGFDHNVTEAEHDLLDGFRTISPVQTRSSFDRFLVSVVPGMSIHDHDAIAELLANYHLEPYPEANASGPLGGVNLTLTGKQDRVVGWRDQWDLVDRYRNHTYAAIDGAGHNVHLDQPAVTAALLDTWLTALATGFAPSTTPPTDVEFS